MTSDGAPVCLHFYVCVCVMFLIQIKKQRKKEEEKGKSGRATEAKERGHCDQGKSKERKRKMKKEKVDGPQGPKSGTCGRTKGWLVVLLLSMSPSVSMSVSLGFDRRSVGDNTSHVDTSPTWAPNSSATVGAMANTFKSLDFGDFDHLPHDTSESWGFEDAADWACRWTKDMSPQFFFWSLWGIYLMACFTGCSRRKRRRNTRVIKRGFPRTKVSHIPLGPRKCRYVTRTRTKHARMFTRNKRSVLCHQRRLYARKDRFIVIHCASTAEKSHQHH